MAVNLYIYTHEFPPSRGGIATYCAEFAQASKFHFSSTTVHADKAAQALDPDHSYKVFSDSRNDGTHGMRSLLSSRKILRQNLKKYPNHYHLLAEPGPILALGMTPKKLSSDSIFITLHGSEINRWQSSSLGTTLARRAFANAKAISAVSTPIAENARKAFPEFAEKITVVSNALPSAFSQLGLSPKAHKTDRLSLLSVGRIHRRKGFDQVLAAIAGLPRKIRNKIDYTIAGSAKDATFLGFLRKEASRLNVSLDIILNPDDAGLKQCYESADVFALTSVPHKSSIEGFGLVYLEAGAFGLPCIAYDTGGVREAVIDKETGFLLPLRDTSALSDKILYFLKHPEERIRMGKNNYTFAHSRSWSDVVQETLLRDK